MTQLLPSSGNGKNAKQRRSFAMVSFGKYFILVSIMMDETVLNESV
jgi:hypothetical protein